MNKFVDCFVCHGHGKIYLGERDPIEGNKMRPTQNCYFCRGIGKFKTDSPIGHAIEAYNTEYNKQIKLEEEKERLKKEKERFDFIKNTLYQNINALSVEQLVDLRAILESRILDNESIK